MEFTEQELKLIEELTEVMVEEEKLGKENSKKELEKIVSEKMFGPGLTDKRVNIRWGSLFSKSQCPICNEKLEKKGGEYVCGKCGLKILAELYEKAKEQHMKESELNGKESTIREKMGEMKLTPEEVDEMYNLAIERSEAAKNTMEKRG